MSGITRLNKRVRRVSHTTIRDGRKLRPLVAELQPGDVIKVWPLGTRAAFSISIAQAYQYAGKLEGERIRREKAAAKKANRK